MSALFREHARGLGLWPVLDASGGSLFGKMKGAVLLWRCAVVHRILDDVFEGGSSAFRGKLVGLDRDVVIADATRCVAPQTPDVRIQQ